MQKKTMGSFMAALRKANGYTQQQIADKLNVSNKTVSKWECDDGYPEISVLPAIAELYGVTVDELLRGEKANDTTQKETNNQKAEEQIKYLCDKSFSKFNNGAIVALALGLCSLILAFVLLVKTSITGYLFINFPIYIILAFFALALCAVSVVVILITFNNLVSKIPDNDIIEKSVFYKKLSKCISSLSTNIALAVAACLSLLASIVVEWGTAWYIILGMPIAFLSIITGILVRLALRKKYGVLNFGISPEKQKYRKKHTVITAIALLLVIALNVLVPIAEAIINDKYTYYSYSFDSSDVTAGTISEHIDVNTEYDPLEDPKRDYYKCKNHIMGEKDLYEVLDERFDELTGECELDVEKIDYVFNKTDDGYEFKGTDYYDIETLTFNSLEEKEKYEAENVFPFDFNFQELKRKVTFNDEILTIHYCGDMTFSSIYDIAPVSILAIFGEILIVLIISAIVYKRKTKNL